MKLSDASIKFPVSVVVGVLFVALFGFISLFRIPIQLTPDVDRPIINVSTFWPGASPEEVEQDIIQRQEEQLNTLEGLVKMTSQSQDSNGQISLEFSVGVDPDATLLRVSNKLDQVTQYPPNAERPVLTSGGAGNTNAITWIILDALPERDLDVSGQQVGEPGGREHLAVGRRRLVDKVELPFVLFPPNLPQQAGCARAAGGAHHTRA